MAMHSAKYTAKYFYYVLELVCNSIFLFYEPVIILPICYCLLRGRNKCRLRGNHTANHSIEETLQQWKQPSYERVSESNNTVIEEPIRMP